MGITAELVLGILCGNDTGGIHVVVIVHHAPAITGLHFDPSKFVGLCQPSLVTVDATEGAGVPLTCAGSVLSGSGPLVLQANQNQAFFEAFSPDDYDIWTDYHLLLFNDCAACGTPLTCPQ